MVKVTQESLAARIEELEAGPRSLKEDFALQAYLMLSKYLETHIEENLESGMDRIDADFTVLQELADRIERDPNNAGWYMHRAYMLGNGCDVNEALGMPPRDYSKPMLKLIMGGKNG
ncbi:hypothetical protein GUK76_03055 [Enterobacter hormaechei]|uniref:hypothetical protein n=1 Tax=Enterobacter hormaechei TaxID=158836 RepID=UPI0005F8EDE8|nr:hypothetical protein [Enterobacter hormaechei]CAE7623363.1 hypothetical protein AI2762V1_3386 [Enterobacter cloacae]KJX24904.1 hypothetical protein SG74_04215 [Enterobacter hormaechei subsp. xiangfangensis]MZY19465.1 hypothetical protein [Enterobacter hormaechei]MZY54433.1 hypothetical protein [Enterobacter hormaechei]CAH3815148.1 hypothetical protein AI2762V1_3386 [Enterobacter cloacae]